MPNTNKTIKYEQDGNIAVLVSHGYGAGWSTSNERDLAFDKRVVEFYLKHKDDQEWMKNINIFGSVEESLAERYFKSIGYQDVYFGGFNQITIEWIPKGTAFRICQYDGNEYVEFRDEIPWNIA